MNQQNEFIRYANKHVGIATTTVEGYVKYQNKAIPQLHAFTPSVIEERQLNITQMDVFSRLMMDRIIFLGRAVDDYVANVIQAQLLFLTSLDPKRDIQMYINSPGGSVTAGLGIYDTMQYIGPNVSTICTSMAASMAAVLLSSGKKGKRVGLKNSRIMIHQPSGGIQGQVTEMKITYELFISLQKVLYQILSDNTDQSYEKIEADCDRDNWMTAQEAIEYGLIDEIL